ncbi:MAG: CPBP family intramembrane metalloprotease [Lewinellaceae bacterium]|nr:CPBP family intramembrane metalloprotease [Lewinellaceae bacterium]MCB9291058.1 CPBP family intramembrane metalloprotease [Lewinellaceae bacterium]
MKRYLFLSLKIISFILLVALFQVTASFIILDPLLKVLEEGDLYGLITVRPSEFFALSMAMQFLGSMLIYSMFKMKDYSPSLPFFPEAGRAGVRQALWGTALGSLLILALAAVLLISGMVSFDIQPFSIRQLGGTLALAIFIALAEEIIFRGYVLQELLENMGRDTALGISALIFALMHFSTSSFNWIPLINLFLSGLLLGLVYLRFNSIWGAVGLHFSWNFMQGPVLGFKVSGNDLPAWLAPQLSSAPEYFTGSTYGLEGTLIATLILMATIAWLYAGLSQVEYGRAPLGLQPESIPEPPPET